MYLSGASSHAANAIGGTTSQGRLQRAAPTCVSRFKTRRHTAWWGALKLKAAETSAAFVFPNRRVTLRAWAGEDSSRALSSSVYGPSTPAPLRVGGYSARRTHP